MKSTLIEVLKDERTTAARVAERFGGSHPDLDKLNSPRGSADRGSVFWTVPQRQAGKELRRSKVTYLVSANVVLNDSLTLTRPHLQDSSAIANIHSVHTKPP